MPAATAADPTDAEGGQIVANQRKRTPRQWPSEGLWDDPGTPVHRPGTGSRRAVPGSSAIVYAYAALLVLGLCGTVATLWTLLDTDRSARVPARMGLERVAGRWQDVLSLLALPSLMFCIVLTIWSAFELYRRWRRRLEHPLPGVGARRRAERETPGDIPRRRIAPPPERLRLRGPR